MEDGRDATGTGGSVNGAVSGGAASGSAATTSSAGGAAAAAALVLATEDQGCPAGWQANPSTKGGKWVKPESGDDAGCEKEGEGGEYVRSNSNTLKGVKETDEEIRLSVMDLIGDEEEAEEEVEGV